MSATEIAISTARLAAQAASDKKASNLVAFDVSQALAITDIFLVASASNERQVGAVVDGVEEALLAHGLKPVRREGDRENRWVLLDYLDVVVHVQHSEERELYSLERLWKDCPQIDLKVVEPEPDQDESETPLREGQGMVPPQQRTL
ncbi:ribosome silencing factor [Luteococcus sanguinis]|uniref:Ribosomal silencing factor RsfS n=1 Tax=Luteococcus sanguinis TaxID=174038 RepID=A0ABW1X4P2_9ACTN